MNLDTMSALKYFDIKMSYFFLNEVLYMLEKIHFLSWGKSVNSFSMSTYYGQEYNASYNIFFFHAVLLVAPFQRVLNKNGRYSYSSCIIHKVRSIISLSWVHSCSFGVVKNWMWIYWCCFYYRLKSVLLSALIFNMLSVLHSFTAML